jgi:hypothetical protein
LLARQNLVAAVGALFLSAGATAAWAATDEERSQPRGDGSRGSETESSKSRGNASQSTETRNAESQSSLRATLREDRLPEERQTEPQSEPQPEWAGAEQEVVAGVPTATLEAIASCESGGNPTAVSADGTYRGKYQFDTGTWAAVGGSGDPAAAPEAEQDYRAALLYAQSGPSQWPMCGQ